MQWWAGKAWEQAGEGLADEKAGATKGIPSVGRGAWASEGTNMTPKIRSIVSFGANVREIPRHAPSLPPRANAPCPFRPKTGTGAPGPALTIAPEFRNECTGGPL
jgi:hypothetical protein